MYDFLNQRLFGALSIALVAAAVLAAGAQAQRPDDRPGAIGVGGTAVSVPDAVERAAGNAGRTEPVRPDDVAASRGPGALGSGLWETPRLAASGSSFHLEDAVLGAAGALGAALLAGALAVFVRSRRRIVLP